MMRQRDIDTPVLATHDKVAVDANFYRGVFWALAIEVCVGWILYWGWRAIYG